MKPLWPSMLMSSTLVRDSSSVLRSRPIGLPRYQVNEKCGPDDAAVLQPLAAGGVACGVDEADGSGQLADRLVADPAAFGKNGPCLAFCWVGGADGCVFSEPDELVEQAATSARAAAPMAMEGSLRLTEPAS